VAAQAEFGLLGGVTARSVAISPGRGRRAITASPEGPRGPDDLQIEIYRGSRDSLRPLFELAEDSAAELDSYIDAGRVLVATSDREIIGHLQLTGTGDPRQAEIKNMAVRENRQGQGIGRRLIQAAIELAAAESVTTILVATAAADIGNLRFYQRQGFRMRSVERDAFTPATGYPPGLLIDGIELRDRVWLDRVVLGEWPIFQVRMRV
jgi:GNAT superfamily N-acetyltransferase